MSISSLSSYTLKAPGRASGTFEFEPFDADGNPEGSIDFGYTSVVNQTIDPGTPTEIKSRRNDARATVAEFAGEVSQTMTVTTQSPADALRNLWYAMTTEVVTQTASAVTNEELTNILEGRFYRFGVSTSNPVGIKGASSVALRNHDSTKAAWQSTTAYSVGDNVEKVSDDGKVFRCKVAGTSGGTEPTWVVSAIGDETTDGTVTWEYIAATNVTYTLNTDYETDLTEATGAKFLWTNSSPPLYLYADYTPTANTRTRAKTGTTKTKSGRARFIADKPYVAEYVWRSVTLKASGDDALLADETTPKEYTFELTVLEPTDGTSAMYVDGEPS